MLLDPSSAEGAVPTWGDGVEVCRVSTARGRSGTLCTEGFGSRPCRVNDSASIVFFMSVRQHTQSMSQEGEDGAAILDKMLARHQREQGTRHL